MSMLARTNASVYHVWYSVGTNRCVSTVLNAHVSKGNRECSKHRLGGAIP